MSDSRIVFVCTCPRCGGNVTQIVSLQWEGIVTELLPDTFLADLIDLSDRSKPCEIAEIPLVEIPDADQELLQPGCVFYWIIGFQTTLGGQKSRMSEIHVRRNPKWPQHAIEKIKERGKRLYEKFRRDGSEYPSREK
jgi:hypothetical protein